MTQRPYVLLIARYAPPTNAAEAIQVRRILAELDKSVSGRLVSVQTERSSWTPEDASLELTLSHFDTIRLSLPFHSFINRILSSHYMAHFHVPDAMRWIIGKAGAIIADLPQKPDILYSRSYPLSAALLAQKLKGLSLEG